jgi:hypothetical protein
MLLFRVWNNDYPEEGYELIEAATEYDARKQVAARDSDTTHNDFHAELVKPSELTIEELQKHLPWGANDYSDLYKENAEPHKQYRHDAIHLAKAAGILLVTPEEMDHTGTRDVAEHRRAEDEKRLADVVIVALHMATTHPSGPIDLAKAIEARLVKKFSTGGNDAK